MAHKRKNLDEPKKGQPLRPDQVQALKEEYFATGKMLEKALQEQRKTEMTHLENLRKEQAILGVIQAMDTKIREVEINPDLPKYVFRNFEGGWNIPFTLRQADKTLSTERRETLDRIKIQEDQARKASEKQFEIQSHLRENYKDMEKRLG